MFQIIWTQKAEKQFNNTLLYWVEHNKSNLYSKKLLKEVNKKEIFLAKNPNVGTLLDYDLVFKVPVLNFFSLIYRLKDQEIIILAFWDNRRNPENLEL